MILIVDDKYENLFSLKTLLQLYAYETDTAASGEEALRKILKNEYSVIILDVQMPDMDGYEVAEAMSGINRAHWREKQRRRRRYFYHCTAGKTKQQYKPAFDQLKTF